MVISFGMMQKTIKNISFKKLLNNLYMNIPKSHKTALKLPYFRFQAVLCHILNGKKLKSIKNKLTNVERI